ncbi:MAG: hypothetical protein MUC79_05490 [Thiobacillaceae bacterium]|nr:hypothetical protein [Thiobacillaceae bacterium]
MQTANPELMAGALDNLMRFLLTGCRHSAGRAALLLERLAAAPDTDVDLELACQRMSDRLAERRDDASAPPRAGGRKGGEPRHV